MPRIFDNLEKDTSLLKALQETLTLSHHSDFCVGYFNLRGWKQLDSYIEKWGGGDGNCCRLLVGMQRLPQEYLREASSILGVKDEMSNQKAISLKRRLAEDFRQQLMLGVPTNEDEAGLRRLAAQIKAKKVIVKLYLKHQLHAKLYLCFRTDPINPIVGFLGSSNLTFSGLSNQGELNIDVLDGDACSKLQKWFEDRWTAKFCIDISDELVQIINESWAREDPPPPYHIYIKMAYHLAQEARAGLTEFSIPRDFNDKLFEFQKAAVKIAARHVNKRGGVLIGDVVGLGKTLIATALARVFEDDHFLETLIICPKNLVEMWEDYRIQYRLRGKVISLSQTLNVMDNLPPHRIVLIDESHNLRNREGKRYQKIRAYIEKCNSKVILLSATPYNKELIDLSNQLRLFVPEDQDIGIRPDNLLREMGELEFNRLYQCPTRSLQAFEKSEYPDDWRELMRLYLVRRTRTFIKENYAEPKSGTGRKYLTFSDGTRYYFPDRVPKTVKFKSDEKDPDDQYARLYAPDVVAVIESLALPRYGLKKYVAPKLTTPPTQEEASILQDLSRAGKRLMGFCRTNLFKRLESSGHSFLQSVERHILRNYVYIHALQNGLPVPIGTQDAGLLDAGINDEDTDSDNLSAELFDNDDNGNAEEMPPDTTTILRTEEAFKNRAAEIYQQYSDRHFRRRFKWLRSSVFVESLAKDLEKDAKDLLKILQERGEWDAEKDTKLNALFNLINKKHPNDKILVFTQFADTVRYIEPHLKARGVAKLAGVTGASSSPTHIAWRFSPVSNYKPIGKNEQLRVVIATDVLSEGQNLQDCFIIVNYDLPWAIIRLIQRAGRVDRIGQKAENILCYSFMPAKGVEEIISLRRRVRGRLRANAEVLGTDEAFFEEEERENRAVVNLYNEKAGTLDDEEDAEVDLSSYAYQIWKNAIERDPALEKIIPQLDNVILSTRQFKPTKNEPDGVLVYTRTAQGNDMLAWIDRSGKSVSESQFAILKAAECAPDTPKLPRTEDHHELVRIGVKHIAEEEKTLGGTLGRPSGAKYRTYERLKRYADEVRGTLFDTPELVKAIEEIYLYQLRDSAKVALNRLLKSGVSDQTLAELVLAMREDGKFVIIQEKGQQTQQPRIICSMGLCAPTQEE